MASSEACPHCDGNGYVFTPDDRTVPCDACDGFGKKPSVCPTCGNRSRRGSFSNSADSIAPAGLCRNLFHSQAPTDPMPGSEIRKGPTMTYIRGLGRDYPVPKRSHLYFGNFDYVGDPLCRYGWNRDDDEGDGSGYSIWRGNTGKLGICRICLRRAKREGLIEWQPAYKGHQPNGRD
jgi:ribosomal protein S14